MEAPVSGSKQPAEQGQLIFLCGGDRKLFDKSIPLLEVMGKAHFFLGKVGNGANMVRDGIYNCGVQGVWLLSCRHFMLMHGSKYGLLRRVGTERHRACLTSGIPSWGAQGVAALLQTHWACSMLRLQDSIALCP